jgi:hypothetical protein
VFVGGACDATVTIRQGVLVSSLAAASLGGTIDIETYLKGKIIARAGGITSLTIGNNPHANPLSTTHGFIASIQTPDWDDTTEVFPYTTADEPEAIIRVQSSIGYLDISQMVQGNKVVPPMVESPRIDVLRVGLLHDGVIWSGRRTGCTPNPGDLASYASFGDAEIVDTWAKSFGDFPEYNTGIFCSSFDRFDIVKRHRADLYFDDLIVTEHFRIGCGLGREESPTPVGLIAVRDSAGLRGQVSIASFVPPDHPPGVPPETPCAPSQDDWDLRWQGVVRMSADGIEIKPARFEPALPDVAPYYDRHSADLGGGSVGQAPTHLHDTSCDPPCARDPQGAGVPAFVGSRFCHNHTTVGDCGTQPNFPDESIILEFYDYVISESAEGAEPPFTCTSAVNTGADYTQFMKWAYEPVYANGPARRLRIWGDPARQVDFIEGMYVIRPRLSGWPRLLCDRLMTAEPTPVGEDFPYYFYLGQDCNHNGTWDHIDVTTGGWPDANADGTPDCCQGIPICDPDYNQDGNTDQDDVAYLLNVIAGGANPMGLDPDFNRDGNVDQDDYAALINSIASATCP